MFTGIVQTLATVASVRAEPPGKRLVVCAPREAAAARVGDSVAVNGCCLTVVEITGELLVFEAGPETLRRTNLGVLAAGSQVNLETSLRIGDALSGHFVTGHIDGTGSLARRSDDGDWSTCWFECPADLTRQMASKGSIAVDGVSLTLVDVVRGRFSVQLIPHTLAVTTLGCRQLGDRVNLETDLLAKYVESSVVSGQLSVVGMQAPPPDDATDL
ncbi:MAG TPA: riboflavin synthase [Pirellulales bacterium]|jgi:riboflavin synthase|nr:riboflavin synthase [Pirellulales bacterium]